MKKCLVLVHHQQEYAESLQVMGSIRKYIKRNTSEIYQLLNTVEKGHRYIKEGKLFDSSRGEVPKELLSDLQVKQDQGFQIVVAGGVEHECLRRTIDQLKSAGIRPKIFYDGVYPKKPKGMKRLWAKATSKDFVF